MWRQYKSFAAQYLDRARYHQGQPLHFQPLHFQPLHIPTGGGSEDNPRLLEEAISRGRNGVLLMSHVGNWEAGALSLREKGIPVMILLGAKAGEAMDGAMRDGLQRQGVELVAVDERSGDPLHIISAYRFLRTRGMVAMSADRLWQPDQPALVRPFLGGTVRLPRGPFALAYAVQAPMYVFFILRAGAMCYREIVFPPIEYAGERRGPKETALEHAADQYLSRLREVLRRHPEHWHHFQPFVDFGESDGAAR